MRDTVFAEGEYYHVFNRGVDKRCIFENTLDFQRFYESMYLFNDQKFKNNGSDPLFSPSLLAAHEVFGNERELFVDIISFCIMPNHFHMLLLQRRADGISKFLHKLCMSYAKYFNTIKKRSGRLFEGPFKAVHVKHHNQLLHLPRYIHLNALDLSLINWREHQIENWSVASDALARYPWSSHHAYISSKQELPVVSLDIVRHLFPTTENYIDFLKQWVLHDLAMVTW